ncbi:hypothetical protein pb186bvf_012267 [Paramecium bursaria]
MNFRVELNKQAHILRSQCFQRVKNKHTFETKHFILKISGRIISDNEILDEEFLTKHKIYFEYNQVYNQLFDTDSLNPIPFQVPVIKNKLIHVKVLRTKDDKLLQCLQNRFEYNLPKNLQINEIKAKIYSDGILRKAYQSFDLEEKEDFYELLIKYEDVSKVVLFIKDKGILDKVDRNKPFYKLSPDEFIEEYKEDNALLVKITGRDKKMIIKDYIDISERNDRLTFQNLTDKLYLELEIIKQEFQSDIVIELEEYITIELKLINFCTKNHQGIYEATFNIYNNLFDLENMLKIQVMNKNMRFYKREQDYNEEQQQFNRNLQQANDKSIYGLKLIREILSSQQIKELENINQQKNQMQDSSFIQNHGKNGVKLELFVSII